MSKDGFEEFSDRDFSQDDSQEIELEVEVSTDFFGDDNRGFRETTVESPFEIPYSNMRDLGKRKPKVIIEDQTIHVPERDNDVNIGLPARSGSGSPRNDSENEGNADEKPVGGAGGISDLLKSLQRRGQEDTDSPRNELGRDAARAEVRDIVPSKKARTAQEDYDERMAKYSGGGVAMNGILEEDEFGFDDPLQLLGLGSDKKKKKKPKAKESTGIFPKLEIYSIGVDKPAGLTSAVQAQAFAAQKEKEKMEILHVGLFYLGSADFRCIEEDQRR